MKKSEIYLITRNNTQKMEMSELNIRDLLIRELFSKATGKTGAAAKIVHKRNRDDEDRDIIELYMSDGAKWLIFYNNGGYPL